MDGSKVVSGDHYKSGARMAVIHLDVTPPTPCSGLLGYTDAVQPAPGYTDLPVGGEVFDDLTGTGVDLAGLWIENGELTFPVSEITIAGTLQEMLQGIEAIGSDLEFRGALASPTLLISEMTISGQ